MEFVAGDLSMPVLPQQVGEFVCPRCSLVYPRSQLGAQIGGQPVCRDCLA